MVNIRDWLIFKILEETCRFTVVLLKSFLNFLRRIKGIIKDHFCEKKLGIRTSGVVYFKDDITVCKDSAPYLPTSYYIIKKMLDYLQLSADDVFIDLGCGKGRVILSLATQRLKKVIGIEVRKKLADIARKNLKNLKSQNTPVEIVNADVVNSDVREGTVFFMFHPFGKNTIDKVFDNIRNSLAINPRNIRVLYYSLPSSDPLKDCDWLIPEGEVAGIPLLHMWHSKT